MSHLNIELIVDDLTKLKADACVSTIHRSKLLKKGPLASQIFDKAGESLQMKLLSINSEEELHCGQVIQTDPYGLASNFQHLYFVCLFEWRPENEKYLQHAVEEIMDKASKQKLTSVVIPPLGAGGLKYPPREVALAILQAVIAFNIDQPNSSITSVKIALLDQKDVMLKAFATILLESVSMYNNSNQSQAAPTTASPPSSNNAMVARPNKNLLQYLFSGWGWSPVLLSYQIGPVNLGVGPHVKLTRSGFTGLNLAIGFNIRLDILPEALKAALLKVY